MRPAPSCAARRRRCISPPRERARRAVERQVVEAHLDQELEPALELATIGLRRCGRRRPTKRHAFATAQARARPSAPTARGSASPSSRTRAATARGASRRNPGTTRVTGLVVDLASSPRRASPPTSTPSPSQRRAAALLGVEREPARVELGDREAAHRASARRREQRSRAVGARSFTAPLAPAERPIERSRVETLGGTRSRHEHEIDGVLLGLAEPRRVVGRDERAVAPRLLRCRPAPPR